MSGNIALILIFTIKDCHLLASEAMPIDKTPEQFECLELENLLP